MARRVLDLRADQRPTREGDDTGLQRLDDHLGLLPRQHICPAGRERLGQEVLLAELGARQVET